MEPTNEGLGAVAVGQTASIDMFGASGGRVKLSGRVVGIDGGVIRVLLERGRVNSLLRGTCVMVECHEGAESLRFVSNLVDIEIGLDRGAQLLLELPLLAHLQSRKFNRHPVHIPVDYAVEGGEWRKGTTDDLGGNGARLIAEGAVPLGTAVALRFDLGNLVCDAGGKVKHVTQVPGAVGALWGVQFTSLDPSHAARLWSFLKTALLGRK